MQLFMLMGGALLIGFIQGFLHCSGMCGPFVLAYSLGVRAKAEQGASPRTLVAAFFKSQLLHNLGRIVSFTILGAVFGAMGSFLNTLRGATGIEAISGLIGGMLMIGWAVDEFRTGHGGGFVERFSILSWKPVQRALRVGIQKTSLGYAFFSGILLGLHPCGLLFALLLAASATGSALAGGLSLFAFGLGTIPSLLTVATIGWYGKKRLQGRVFAKVTAALMTCSGILFILRGLAMNHWIPSVNAWLF
ncbi:sulfite exporter TauE/SafE family protein [Ferroacidibacillus organovorans]|nr:sulfite exporter TauE/SafE family protein [Ferroacidibacillus organovorans]